MYTFRFVTYNLNGEMDPSQMERILPRKGDGKFNHNFCIYESQLNEPACILIKAQLMCRLKLQCV